MKTVDKSGASSYFELRLAGDRYAEGEIPLSDLARIASETQRLVRKVARLLTDRSRLRRTSQLVEDLTELRLVGFHRGSTILQIAGPPMQAQLELPETPPDVGVQAVSAVMDGIEAVSADRALPSTFDEAAARSLADWFDALEAFDYLEVRAKLPDAEKMSALQVSQAREVSRRQAVDLVREPVAHTQAIEGMLYAINLRTGVYGIEDDSGHHIRCSFRIGPFEHVGGLLGKRVRAMGDAQYDFQGRLSGLEIEDLVFASTLEELKEGKFFAGVELDALIKMTSPLESIDLLGIPDLPAEDADAFLAALKEL